MKNSNNTKTMQTPARNLEAAAKHKALENMIMNWSSGPHHEGLHSEIDSMFAWRNTVEGFDFWGSVFLKSREGCVKGLGTYDWGSVFLNSREVYYDTH